MSSPRENVLISTALFAYPTLIFLILGIIFTSTASERVSYVCPTGFGQFQDYNDNIVRCLALNATTKAETVVTPPDRMLGIIFLIVAGALFLVIGVLCCVSPFISNTPTVVPDEEEAKERMTSEQFDKAMCYVLEQKKNFGIVQREYTFSLRVERQDVERVCELAKGIVHSTQVKPAGIVQMWLGNNKSTVTFKV
jgi:hypothetical protein